METIKKRKETVKKRKEAVRKRTNLTLENKLEIIKELENNLGVSHLANRYKVSPSVISRIKANKQKIFKLKEQMSFYNQLKVTKKDANKQRRHLTWENKLAIIKKLENDHSVTNLANAYGVSASVISRIKTSKEKINKFKKKIFSDNQLKIRKRGTDARNTELDDACYLWYLQNANIQPISNTMLRKKALEFNRKLDGPDDFRGSQGWSKLFKKRHSINFTGTGEKYPSYEDCVDELKKLIAEKLLNENYSASDIYNADETGLYWKLTPKQTLCPLDMPEMEIPKDRVTVILCSNASGSHKLPLSIIGRPQDPKCMKNIQMLPIHYAEQKNGWIDSDLFLNWYVNIFIKEVKKFKKTTGNKNKTLLIIDNAPIHLDRNQLNELNENFSILFLSPNMPASIQPLNQGVVTLFKNLYRKYLLEELIMQDYDNQIRSFFKSTHLDDACRFMCNAWNDIKTYTLKSVWQNVLPICDEATTSYFDECNDEIDERTFLEKLNFVGEYVNISPDTISTWLNCDANDIGYKLLSDDEIVATVRNNNQSDRESDQSDLEDSNSNVCSESVPTMKAKDAYSSLDKFLSWFKIEPECTNDIKNCLDEIKKITYKKIIQENKKK